MNVVISNQRLAERDAQIALLTQALSERDRHIKALQSSISWRITWPLRFIALRLARVHHALRLSRHDSDGPADTLQGFREQPLSPHEITEPDTRVFERNDYTHWIRNYDTLTNELRATMREQIDCMAHRPLISVIMSTYNTKPECLIDTLESVRAQIYSNWELCIADDASTDPMIRPILERYARDNSRIKLEFHKNNLHICASFNTALQRATGEWVSLLGQGDLLSEHALFWVARSINEQPDARLIYSDEDKIDDVGNRSRPYFKCDWNLDLFYSYNIFSQLGVFRADLLNEVGGFRPGLEGAWDYDLVLRCIERVESRQIHHIPRVLYHQRKRSEGSAPSTDADACAMLAGERALNDHFQRLRIEAKAEFVGHGYRVRYKLPDDPPLVSLIILTKNGVQLLKSCVESIFQKTTYPNYEVLIVDNGSDDPATLDYFNALKAQRRVRVLKDDRPFNFSALNNAAVKSAQGTVLGLLNNDLEVISADWLSEMVSLANIPDVGAVGARLYYPSEQLQHGGVLLGIAGPAIHAHYKMPRGENGYFGRANLIQSFSAVTGACLVIRKEVYEAVGGLNEIELRVAFNDIDFCLRVREAGYRNVWTPYAELYHHESATRGADDTPLKQALAQYEAQYLAQRWGNLLLNDPAYSPNLTLHHADFSLAWPPRIDQVLIEPRQAGYL